MPQIAPRHTNLADEQDAPVEMEGAQGVKMTLLIGREHGAPTFAMRRFTIEPGGHSPQHSHPYEHEVVVLEGAGTLFLDGRTSPLGQGDVVFVPPDVVHQFRADQGVELRFICLVPAQQPCGGPTPGS